MGLAYRIGRAGGRFIFFCTMRLKLIRPEAADRPGPFLIASTHLSHLDPFLLGVLHNRPIDWMTRIEFFKWPGSTWLLHSLNAFAVRRYGVPVSAIRTSIDRLRRGRVVGICPEGGVARGKLSMVRGGPIKRGVCLISYRTGAPVLPCVVLGSHDLNRVGPWLPFKRARLQVAWGDRVILPRLDLDRRAAREIMAQELQREYARLYRELLETCDIAEESIP